MPDGARPAPSEATLSIATDRPVLVFGGCYSNREATEALLAAAHGLGIPASQMICTGDVVAYGADPEATLNLIRAAGIATVMGNCEESLAANAADCGCGFAFGSSCARLSAAWFAHAARHVNAEARGWMAGLPRRIDLLLAGRRIAIVHGAPSRINAFLFASTPAHYLETELSLAGTDAVVGGHCGLPFTRRLGGRLWHNSGAIGLPANDGTPRGWFSLLTPRDDGIDVRHLPLDYDHRSAAGAMRAANLPEDYATTMESGIWPSFDILPPSEQSAAGRPLAPMSVPWSRTAPSPAHSLTPSFRARPRPFADPRHTAAGEPHATVALTRLTTLWFNTGTLCNIACVGCYIESSPRNDRLLYLSLASFERFLNEAATRHPELREIGFTGGEPFMNSDTPDMIESALERGFSTLVLTNAMRPMQRLKERLAGLHARYGARLAFRVSLDHFTREGHEKIRGPRTFEPALAGLVWLARAGFFSPVAARISSAIAEAEFRAGFAVLFRARALPLDAFNPAHLVLFPELVGDDVPPEVGKTCWRALHARGREVMCASSRMIVHRKGAPGPSVVACTLQPYEPGFDMGQNLADAARPVTLNHPHCARFCVFGAASCSGPG
jgi:uncharacterized radical SAM superfamily Fe-S cluster-containing enzyme